MKRTREMLKAAIEGNDSRNDCQVMIPRNKEVTRKLFFDDAVPTNYYNSKENVIAWLTENESNTAVHTANLVEPENNSLEFIDINNTDIMILESPVDYDKTSTYNQNAVLIEVPYDSILQDLQNIPSGNNSCTGMPVHNKSGNIIEPITNYLEVTPAKTFNSNPEYQEPVKIVINGRKQGRIIINKKKEKQ